MVDGKPETAENIHILPAAKLHDSTHRALYANIRGLRQGAGELAALIELEKQNFIFLTECHIAKDEPINIMWIPYISTPLYSHLGNESVRKIDFYGLTIALTSF